MLLESGESFEFQVSWGVDLQSEHERYLTERRIGRPVIVTDYPKEIKAFYMRLNDDDKHRAGHGRPGPRHRRDHRRQPARGARAMCCGAGCCEAGLNEEDYYWYLDLRQLRDGPPRRLRPWLRTHCAVHHRRVQHPRCDPLPPHPEERRVLEQIFGVSQWPLPLILAFPLGSRSAPMATRGKAGCAESCMPSTRESEALAPVNNCYRFWVANRPFDADTSIRTVYPPHLPLHAVQADGIPFPGGSPHFESGSSGGS